MIYKLSKMSLFWNSSNLHKSKVSIFLLNFDNLMISSPVNLRYLLSHNYHLNNFLINY